MSLITTDPTELGTAIQLIQEAVNLKAMHDSMKYNFLVKQLTGPFSDKIMLWVQALSQCTTLILPCHVELTSTIFNLQIPPAPQIYEFYCSLLLHMVTANTAHVPHVIATFFKRIIPSNADVLQHLTTALKRLLQLVPLSAPLFPSIFIRNLPNRWKDIQEFIHYINYFLNSFPELPELSSTALNSAMERCVLLDSELQKTGDVFDMEENDVSSSLEQLLYFLLGFINQLPPHLEKTFYMCFDSYVVTTPYLSHTPTLYLAYCNNEQRATNFVSFLLSRLSDFSRIETHHALSLCHLGSYVSVSSLIPAPITYEVLNKLGDYFRSITDNTLRVVCCEQVLRIIVYKLHDLQTRLDVTPLFVNGSFIQQMILSNVDPLGNCSSMLVQEFISICKERGLLDAQALLAQNALLLDPIHINVHLCSYQPYDVPSRFRENVSNLIYSIQYDELSIQKDTSSSWTKNSWDFSM